MKKDAPKLGSVIEIDEARIKGHISRAGVDIAKSVFHVHAVDAGPTQER
jgi:hypothetical protein